MYICNLLQVKTKPLGERLGRASKSELPRTTFSISATSRSIAIKRATFDQLGNGCERFMLSLSSHLPFAMFS